MKPKWAGAALVSLAMSAGMACSDDGNPGDAPSDASGGASGGALGSGGTSSSGGGSSGKGSGGDSSASGGAGLESGGSPSASGGTGGGPFPSDQRQVFLLIGQSNMEGVPTPEAVDRETNPRVEVLGYDASCQSRAWNVWGLAAPPLHRCWAGVGPGDGFARVLAAAWPEAKIGLVPCAISGVDIDFFRKGVVSSRRGEFQIPPDNSASGAYEMVIQRARVAQETGVIRGILFHQGESDNESPAWVNKVAGLVADLRADLDLGEEVPFIAGELYCCSKHNTLVHQLPSVIPNAHVVSAAGLNGMDTYHFDLAGQRELGKRYAAAFLQAIGE